ncbi:deazaflavin-dependent nitroreductase [Mycobacteroides abscessus]|nr:deazaflavin-dependent nitroreductase [Mycobacteroides abscessus]
MQIPQSVARFNKYVTNPVQRLWAGWAPSFAIIEHKGRKSGKEFRTPVTAFTTPDGVAILLTYGPDRDWLKNLQAAGGGRVVRGARRTMWSTPGWSAATRPRHW